MLNFITKLEFCKLYIDESKDSEFKSKVESICNLQEEILAYKLFLEEFKTESYDLASQKIEELKKKYNIQNKLSRLIK